MRDPIEDVRDHYDRLSGVYALLWGEHIHHGYWDGGENDAPTLRFVEHLASFAEIERGSRVLDVGCGVGGSALWLARTLDCRVEGITISPIQALTAWGRAQRDGLGGKISVRVQDARTWDAPQAGFDVLWIVEASEHFDDRKETLARLARTLRPQGRLALGALLAGGAPTTPEQERLLGRILDGMLFPSLGTAEDYAGWLDAAGFADIQMEDASLNVSRTWEPLHALAAGAAWSGLLGACDKRVRAFVDACSCMLPAYGCGALRFGIFTARRRP
ncbi:MAG: methyltransferase domain-containing protein [Candidatus Polarisedimenticolia bacterium]